MDHGAANENAIQYLGGGEDETGEGGKKGNSNERGAITATLRPGKTSSVEGRKEGRKERGPKSNEEGTSRQIGTINYSLCD